MPCPIAIYNKHKNIHTIYAYIYIIMCVYTIQQSNKHDKRNKHTIQYQRHACTHDATKTTNNNTTIKN